VNAELVLPVSARVRSCCQLHSNLTRFRARLPGQSCGTRCRTLSLSTSPRLSFVLEQKRQRQPFPHGPVASGAALPRSSIDCRLSGESADPPLREFPHTSDEGACQGLIHIDQRPRRPAKHPGKRQARITGVPCVGYGINRLSGWFLGHPQSSFGRCIKCSGHGSPPYRDKKYGIDAEVPETG